MQINIGSILLSISIKFFELPEIAIFIFKEMYHCEKIDVFRRIYKRLHSINLHMIIRVTVIYKTLY